MKFPVDKLNNIVVNKGNQVGKIFQGIDISQGIVVTQGYSLQESPLPLRFLAYAVATMRLLKIIVNPAVNIRAELFIAREACLLANPSYRRGEIIPRSQRMKDLLEAFIQTFYPNQVGRVKILFDRHIEPGSELDQYLDFLTSHSRVIADEDEKRRIHNFIESRGGLPALRYMTLHPPYLRSPLQGGQQFKDAFLPDSTWDGIHHVVAIGGKAEHIFGYLQEELERRVGMHDDWKWHRIFTPVGGPPTYHRQDHEPCWGDRSLPESVVELIGHMIPPSGAGVLDSIVENLLRDLLTLLLDCSGVENFGKLPDYLAVAKRGGAFDPPTVEILQPGWERLRQLF